jgi:hypothetical protein
LHPLLKLEQEGETFKLTAKDYIPRNTCLGITHIKRDYEVIKTAVGEFLTDSNWPNCMLFTSEKENTLWTIRSVFIGDTISITKILYRDI